MSVSKIAQRVVARFLAKASKEVVSESVVKKAEESDADAKEQKDEE